MSTEFMLGLILGMQLTVTILVGLFLKYGHAARKEVKRHLKQYATEELTKELSAKVMADLTKGDVERDKASFLKLQSLLKFYLDSKVPSKMTTALLTWRNGYYKR